ncbi:hypothetical protein ACFQ0B_24490 [Nonomuraea thailandensis]
MTTTRPVLAPSSAGHDRRPSTMASSGSTWRAWMPTKCATRRSPAPVSQPVSGMPEPASVTPTPCAPMVVRSIPAARLSAWPGVGAVIR